MKPTKFIEQVLDNPKLLKEPPQGVVVDEKLCLEAFRASAGHTLQILEWVPEDLKTEAVCRAAVEADGMNLDFVPENLQTQELRLAACTENGSALMFVDEMDQTPEMCRAAVKDWGPALEFAACPMTVEEQLAAVRDEGEAVQWVDDELKTPELFLEAMEYCARDEESAAELLAEAFPERFFDGDVLTEDVKAVLESTERGKLLAETAERLKEGERPSL